MEPMKPCRLMNLGCGLMVLALVGPARAELMAYEFRGTVDWVINETGQLEIEQGDIFSGRYVFDSLTPDSEPSQLYGIYISPDASMSITVNTRTFNALGSDCQLGVSVPDSGMSLVARGFGLVEVQLYDDRGHFLKMTPSR